MNFVIYEFLRVSCWEILQGIIICVKKETMTISYFFSSNQPHNSFFSNVNWVIVGKISLFKLICRSLIDTKHVCNSIKTDMKNGKIIFHRLATRSYILNESSKPRLTNINAMSHV